MTKEKWKKIKGNILDNFEVEEGGNEHFEEEGGVDIEFIVFKSPLGRVRLEHVTKPVILDKKTNYSRRIGSETKVDYVYSETDFTETMMAYKWNGSEEEWEEMDSKNFE